MYGHKLGNYNALAHKHNIHLACLRNLLLRLGFATCHNHQVVHFKLWDLPALSAAHLLPQICHSAYLPLALPFVWSNLRGFSPPHKLVDLYMLTYSKHLLTRYALRCNPVGSIAVGSNLHMHAANFTHSPVLYVHQLSQPPIYRPCCQDTKRVSVHTLCTPGT